MTAVAGGRAVTDSEALGPHPRAALPRQLYRPRSPAVRKAGFSTIPDETHPLSAAFAGTMARYGSTEQYIWGLRKVLYGITAGLTSEAGTLTAFA